MEWQREPRTEPFELSAFCVPLRIHRFLKRQEEESTVEARRRRRRGAEEEEARGSTHKMAAVSSVSDTGKWVLILCRFALQYLSYRG